MATTDTSKGKSFKVPSSTGSGNYNVAEKSGQWTCDCKAFTSAKTRPCKHIKDLPAFKNASVAAVVKPTKVAPAGTQPTPRGSGLAGLLSGKVAAPTLGSGGKKSKSKVKPIEEVPDELTAHAEVMVAGIIITKAIEDKIKAATGTLRMWAVERYAKIFATTGQRPPTFTIVGGRAKYDFIQTRRINLSPEKVQAVRDLGIPIDDYTDIKGVTINYEAIKRHGLEDKLQKALESMGLSDAILGEIIQPKHELKEGFFDNLYNVVKDSLEGDEKLEAKMFHAMLALDPVPQRKNPVLDIGATDADEQLTESLKVIVESAVASTGNVQERDDEDDDE